MIQVTVIFGLYIMDIVYFMTVNITDIKNLQMLAILVRVSGCLPYNSVSQYCMMYNVNEYKQCNKN